MSSKKKQLSTAANGGRNELSPKYVYSAREAADLLHLSLRIIRAAIGRGELTASKIANRFIIVGSDLIDYVRRHRVYRGDVEK